MVAESPGSDEIAKHRLLVGATGQEFDKSLLSVGLKRSKLYLVNAIACQPVGPKFEANMQKATECCRPLVLHQIKLLGPSPNVMALGKWAWYSLTGHIIALRTGRGFLRPWVRADMEAANVAALNKLRKDLVHHAEDGEAKKRSAGGSGDKAKKP
jgi:uracil-DNA glycosylase family 4